MVGYARASRRSRTLCLRNVIPLFTYGKRWPMRTLYAFGRGFNTYSRYGVWGALPLCAGVRCYQQVIQFEEFTRTVTANLALLFLVCLVVSVLSPVFV